MNDGRRLWIQRLPPVLMERASKHVIPAHLEKAEGLIGAGSASLPSDWDLRVLYAS
jgi:hypothetical protein